MDPERYLAMVFEEMAVAGTRETCVLIAARAAAALSGTYGLCLVSADGDDCLLALENQPDLYVCNLQSLGLYESAASLRLSGSSTPRMLWAKEDFITLPSGERRHIRAALLVPLKAATDIAVAFFWEPDRATDPGSMRTLEVLAKALGVAAGAWRRDRELAARHRLAADQQHRLRNNLALMRSIIRRSRETADSAEHFALHLDARIAAVTRIQSALVTAGAAGVELEELICTELIATAVPGHRFSMQGPIVRLHDKSAQSLALALHELATNSMKFGALAAPDGRLEINWSVTHEQQPRLHLSWVERGARIACAAPRRCGFGHELIERTLPYELGARTRLAFDPGGVTCEINIPLEAYAVTSESPALRAGGGS
jgi:two-component sensor histidine kinase